MIDRLSSAISNRSARYGRGAAFARKIVFEGRSSSDTLVKEIMRTRVRSVGPDASIDKVAGMHGRRRVEDVDGGTMILFDSPWVLRRSQEEHPELTFHDVQPRRDS